MLIRGQVHEVDTDDLLEQADPANPGDFPLDAQRGVAPAQVDPERFLGRLRAQDLHAAAGQIQNRSDIRHDGLGLHASGSPTAELRSGAVLGSVSLLWIERHVVESIGAFLDPVQPTR